ncbi:MAG: polysulfide reductase NrfD [Acidobacteria bacterium]|nr:polysulfide reductase NrfD [Acidobacteriota bacterium]
MHEFEWGFLIVNYLFLGGLSAGLFFVSALASWLQQREDSDYSAIARAGALLAPWPVALGSLLLIFDLGNWWRFYKLFLHFRWQSPMSIGSWLLVVFTGIAFANCWAWVPADVKRTLLARVKLPEAWAGFPVNARILAAIGFPMSIGVAIYTGVLLGAVQARPFWNTNLVAQMFLFSALSSGCAALLIALSLRRQQLDSIQLRFLYTIDVCLISLEFFIVLPYLIHGELSVEAVRQSLALVLGGPYTVAFWVFFLGIGLLLPLAIEVWELAPAVFSGGSLHHNRRLTVLTAALVVFGGYMLRYIFVYAGQSSSFH